VYQRHVDLRRTDATIGGGDIEGIDLKVWYRQATQTVN
jgi:hypothetical protein